MRDTARNLSRALRVVVCSPDRLAETVDPDDESIVLVMFHSYAHDRACPRALLALSGDVGARSVLESVGDGVALVEFPDSETGQRG